jgi:hypothetical protein
MVTDKGGFTVYKCGVTPLRTEGMPGVCSGFDWRLECRNGGVANISRTESRQYTGGRKPCYFQPGISGRDVSQVTSVSICIHTRIDEYLPQ